CGRTVEFALEPGELNRAEKISVRSVLRRWLRVGAAIAAHIEQKQVEQRTVGNFPVDAAWFGRAVTQWHELMKGATPASGEEQGASRIVAAAVERCAGPPVLHDFVIVPLRKYGHFGVEIPNVRIEEVVFVVAAIVVEARCNLALFFGDDISPRLAIWQRLLSRHCAVRVNAVAAMN